MILRRGLHGNAQFAVAEEGKQQDAQHARGGDHHHLLDIQHQASHAPDFVLVGHRQGQRVGAHARDHGDQAPRHIANADGQHNDGKGGLPQDGADDGELDQRAQQGHAYDRAQDRSPVRPAQNGHAHQTRERTEHHQLALGEANRLGGLVNEHKAHRNQPVDAALRYPADQQLKKLQSIYSGLV